MKEKTKDVLGEIASHLNVIASNTQATKEIIQQRDIELFYLKEIEIKLHKMGIASEMISDIPRENFYRKVLATLDKQDDEFWKEINDLFM